MLAEACRRDRQHDGGDHHPYRGGGSLHAQASLLGSGWSRVPPRAPHASPRWPL